MTLSLLSGSRSRWVLIGGVRVRGVSGLGIGDGVASASLKSSGDGGEGGPSRRSGVELIRFLDRGDGDFVAGEPVVGQRSKLLGLRS